MVSDLSVAYLFSPSCQHMSGPPEERKRCGGLLAVMVVVCVCACVRVSVWASIHGLTCVITYLKLKLTNELKLSYHQNGGIVNSLRLDDGRSNSPRPSTSHGKIAMSPQRMYRIKMIVIVEILKVRTHSSNARTSALRVVWISTKRPQGIISIRPPSHACPFSSTL